MQLLLNTLVSQLVVMQWIALHHQNNSHEITQVKKPLKVCERDNFLIPINIISKIYCIVWANLLTRIHCANV